MKDFPLTCPNPGSWVFQIEMIEGETYSMTNGQGEVSLVTEEQLKTFLEEFTKK